MKRHISLVVAVVMVLTLIYTPAGIVYAEGEGTVGNETKGVTEQTKEEVTEQAKEEATEPVKEEVTEQTKEEGTEQVEGEEAPKSNSGEETKANSLAADGTVTDGNTTDGQVGTTGSGEGDNPGDNPGEEQEIGTITATVTKQTATSIALKWDAVTDADGNPDPAVSYKVFLGEKELTPENLTVTATGLKPKTEYRFTIEAYKLDEEEQPILIAKGTKDSYTYAAKPAVPKSLTAKKSFPNYVITWTKDTKKAGYQFRYSTTKGKGTVKTLSAATNSQTIKKLKNGKTYYFQVRVKDQYGKDTKSAQWSKWKTIKVKAVTTGWKAVVKKGKKYGKKYYYVNGVMQKNKEFWLGKLKYYVDKNGVWRGGSKYMWGRCKKQTSGTDTMLVTSRNRHTVCIFKKIDGTWCCQYEWLCSVGKKGSKTPHGKFYVRSKKKSFGKGHTCWYATRYHKKYPKAAFHSVLYKKGSKTKIKDGRLGKNVSNGCVRLSLKWAKWIYDNVKKRSRILIY